MICLDTNIVIALLTRRDHRIAELFRASAPGELAVPVQVVTELWYGVWRSGRVRENRKRLAIFFNAPVEVLPFDVHDAREAGEIRAHLKRADTPIGAYDLLIAAQARRRNATLATSNVKEFAHVPGLAVENWAA
ncbi:MAG: type II toxin-antitoxin system VapC family toxin [Micropepsaceae bacterium]